MLSPSILVSSTTAILGAVIGLVVGLHLAGDSYTPDKEHRCSQALPTIPEALDADKFGDKLMETLTSALGATLERHFNKAIEQLSNKLTSAPDVIPTHSDYTVRRDDWEQDQAFESGGSVLDNAVAQGYWAPHHAEDLSALLPSMSHDQRATLFSRIAEAANQGYIELSDDPLAHVLQ